jgi:hypothetical protein
MLHFFYVHRESLVQYGLVRLALQRYTAQYPRGVVTVHGASK